MTDLDGVPTVVNAEEALRTAPSLVLREDLRIGADPNVLETQLFDVWDLTVAGDDRIYVLDAGNDLVRVFDSGGSYLHSIGGPGQGPGEFRGPRRLMVARDSVVVLELNRFHVFGVDGTLLQSAPYPRDGPRDEGYPYLYADDAEGTASGWAVTVPGAPAASEDLRPRRDSTLVALLRPDSGIVYEPVVRLLGPERSPLADGWSWEAPYMSAEPHVALGPSGELFVASTAAYLIDVFGPDGTPLRRISGEPEPIPVTDDLHRAWIEDRLSFYDDLPMTGEALRSVPMIRDEVPALGHADVRPVVGRMIASSGGGLLVERLDLREDPLSDTARAEWDVLDPHGRIEGRITEPARARFLVYRDTVVYALERDAMDVQHVVRYRIAGTE